MAESILTKLLAEVTAAGNYGTSETRSKELMLDIENVLNKRVLFYFASEVGTDENSLISDEDAFVIENLLSVPSDKKDLVLVLHSNGGTAISAERIIDICRSYCKQKGDSEFIIVVPKRAKSAATILALGADKVFLRDTAELGPIDPQWRFIDANGSVTFNPAYLQVDAIENLVSNIGPLSFTKLKNVFSRKRQTLSDQSTDIKIKLLEQCNYALYVNSKNELALSDSIIQKISKEKISKNPRIKEQDFDIFKDPHITKSHGRLINLKDLEPNSLCEEKIISNINKLFDTKGKAETLDSLLWELYVRKRRLLNDVGNKVVKTVEATNETFSFSGNKIGQAT